MRGIAVVLVLLAVVTAHPSVDIATYRRQKHAAELVIMSPSERSKRHVIVCVTEDDNTPDVPQETDDNYPLEGDGSTTCIRQDFESNATAVFVPAAVGNLDDAFLRFNSSLGPESWLDVRNFEGLKLLSQTDVDCDDYPPNYVPYGIPTAALASLTG